MKKFLSLDLFRNYLQRVNCEETRSAEPECTRKYMRIRAPNRRSKLPLQMGLERGLLIFVSWLTITHFICAASAAQEISNYTNTDQQIEEILKKIQSMHFKDFPTKVAYVNQLFFDKPYSFNALGEGKNGKFDNNPLYRTDAFDCETYVDTVIALTIASDLKNFQNFIRKIRYKNGKVSFTNRNHFTCLDWNKNNQKQHITKDVTNRITDKNNQTIAIKAKTYIDKPNWYKNMPIERIRLTNAKDSEKTKKLASLREKAKKQKKSLSIIPYIPLNKIFPNDDTVDMHIVKQIPNGAIMEIIRPNWDLCKVIGTHLNVSHLGFVIWEDNKPYFIHASSDKLMIVKVPLISYLKIARENPSIKGLNIQIIIPNQS